MTKNTEDRKEPELPAGLNRICSICGGNDADMPCAYTTEKPDGCLRKKRLEDRKDNGMPDMIYIRDDSDGGYEFTDSGDPIGFAYYSESHLQQAIADAVREAEERQLRRIIVAVQEETKFFDSTDEALILEAILNAGGNDDE